MRLIKHSTIIFVVFVFFRIQCNAAPVPKNQVHFINVGQAEAILLEFQHDAILIDAGGEFTCDDRDRGRLLGYLKKFFERRTDLVEDGKGKIHTIIISHPHLDHTMLLMDVMQKYRVGNLVDGGNQLGSGIVPLWAARYYAQTKAINYVTVKDEAITATGLINATLQSVHDNNPDVTLKFLAGARNCGNANNDSLIVWADINGVKFLFTGDDEALPDDDDPCEPEIPFILNRFRNTSVLDVDVYKVGHHGSFNGTSADLLQAMTPKVSVMSAGRFDQQEPGRFHAWQFGHPRDAAVQTIAANTTNTRTPISVKTMTGPAQPHTRVMKKAVYCTCWDNDVVVEVLTGGTIAVH
jgi:competence protein ComEC